MTIEKFPSWRRLPEYDSLKATLLSLLPDRPFAPDFYMLEKDEQRIAMVVCDSTKLTPIEWEKLSLPERVPWLEKVIKTFGHSASASTPPNEPVATAEKPIPKLLTGWHEIAAALEEKYTARNKIKSLNLRFGGPIQNRGAGSQPIVEKTVLLNWWDTLATQQQALTNEQEGRRLSADATHNYGREGELSPEIGGSVKKRRTKKPPKET